MSLKMLAAYSDDIINLKEQLEDPRIFIYFKYRRSSSSLGFCSSPLPWIWKL